MGWPATRAVLAALGATGSPARFVGGCVRNTVLGRPVADIDIATPLPPDEVARLVTAAGLKAVPTGLAHGTVTAVADHVPFEITTLRVDLETDGRRARVAFTDDWQADAARRDFTMNAMSMDAAGTIFDYFGGLADARAGRVRFVGDADRRIAEDALRILRFFRFHAHYGQGPADADALAACARAADRIAILSAERVRAELLKLLAAADPVPAWRLMAEAGVAGWVIGGPGNLPRLAALVRLEPEPDPLRRLAALLEPGDTAALAGRLKLSRAERERLGALLDRGLPVGLGVSPATARRLAYRVGVRTVRDRLLLAAADAQDPAPLRPLLAALEGWQPPVFPLRGQDLVQRGTTPGPAIGGLLKRLEERWIESDFAPGRAELLAEIDRLGAG